MNKKAIAILGAIFVLIVGTLGFLIYLKYSGSKTTTPAAVNSTTTPATGLAPVATSTPIVPAQSGGAVKLTSDIVVSPALFFNGSGVTYFDNQGNLFQATLQNDNGQLSLTSKKQLSIPAKSGISKILWPQSGNDFIAEMGNASGKSSWSFFSSNTGLYTDFPPMVGSVDFMPTGDKIAYVWLNAGKAVLEIGDTSLKTWQKVGDMFQTDNIISVSPNGSQILFYESGPAGNQNNINSVSSDGKVWKTLVSSGYNSGVLWSPNSQRFIFGKKDPSTLRYQLWIYDLSSGEVKNLGLFSTPDKAVWAPDSINVYAAVPASGSSGNSLTSDAFYFINTQTLEKKQYNSGTSAIDGESLFLNATGDKLLFKNAQDGGLYYLDLNQ